MDNIYLVEANYSDYDSSWSCLIGIFLNNDDAINVKEKWEKFHKENRYIFDKPIDWIPEDEDDEWENSDEYYTLSFKYGDLLRFQDITITKRKVNKDIFIDGYKNRTSEMYDLIKVYNRDYFITKIIKDV